MLFRLLVLSLAVGLSFAATSKKCLLYGWEQEVESCYTFGTTKLTYANAKAECEKTTGAYLVKIDNKAENDFLAGKIGNNQHLIGIHASSNEDKFVYTADGTDISYDNFDNAYDWFGLLSLFSNADSVVMNSDGRWTDESASNKYMYICEMPAVELPDNGCPQYYTPGNTDCFFKSFETKNAADATTFCSDNGGTFFYPKCAEEQSFVADLIKEDFTFNAYDNAQPGTFVADDGKTPYLAWDINEPDNGNFPTSWPVEECVAVRYPETLSYDHGCSDVRRFTCRVARQKYCPEGWTTSTDREDCYKYFPDAKSYSDAMADCTTQDANSYLFHPVDLIENDFVAGLVSQDFWIGLKESGTENNEIWSNAKDEVADYKNFMDGEPTRYCVLATQSSGYFWEDVLCDQEPKPYVCARKSITDNNMCP